MVNVVVLDVEIGVVVVESPPPMLEVVVVNAGTEPVEVDSSLGVVSVDVAVVVLVVDS